jgi:preprotein translocase subunit YajC
VMSVPQDRGIGFSAAPGRSWPGLENGTEPMHVLALLAADDNNGSGAAGLVQIGILLLIPLAMYFLMIRPQRRRMREQQALQSSLEVGDEVMTGSGIYGFITGFEDDVVWVEIDDDVQIRVSRAAISGKVVVPGAAAATTGSTDGAGAAELPASAPRRPTLKGGGAKPAADAPAADVPTAGGAGTTDEPADG